MFRDELGPNFVKMFGEDGNGTGNPLKRFLRLLCAHVTGKCIDRSLLFENSENALDQTKSILMKSVGTFGWGTYRTFTKMCELLKDGIIFLGFY